MSSTNEKKTGGSSRREYDYKAMQSKKKVRITAISVVAVVAVLFAAALFINSKYIRRTMPAVTIDGVSFSAAEYDYFFNNAYYEYQSMVYQTMPDYASSMLPTSGTPLASQVYDKESGKTWADFFSENAFNKMGETVRFYNAAKAAGYTLPAEDSEKFESDMSSMKDSAGQYGYSSFNKYLQDVFGKSMNESTLRKTAEIVNLADSYSRHVRDSFEYTPDELAEQYNEKRDSYDTFGYRYFLVRADMPVEEDFDTTEEYETAKADALAAAAAAAGGMAAGINNEDDFIAAALEYDSASYALPNSTLRHYSGDMLGSEYGDWLRDASRKYGDVTTTEISTGCYVVMFLDRSANDYNMANMRQILITPETVSEADFGEDLTGYADALDAASKAAKDKADDLLEQFEEGGATEEKFLELMPSFTTDLTEGGLYENIYRYQSNMAEDINAWLLDPVRKSGDYKLFYSENSGYHLVYFVSHGELYCDYLAAGDLRTADYTEWTESLGTSDVTIRWAFNLRTQ